MSVDGHRGTDGRLSDSSWFELPISFAKAIETTDYPIHKDRSICSEKMQLSASASICESSRPVRTAKGHHSIESGAYSHTNETEETKMKSKARL